MEKRKKFWGRLASWQKAALVLLVLLAVALGARGLQGETPQEAAAAKPRVKVLTVQESAADAASYAAEIRSQYESELSFLTSGKVVRKNVKVGDRVRAGDVLAVLDTRDLKQSVNNARAQQETADSALRLAQKTAARSKTLYEQGAVSQADYDQAMQAYESAAAQVRQAAAQVASSENQLGYGTLVADRAGVVTKVEIATGEVVEAGETVAVVADEGSLEAVFAVPEDVVQDIEENMEVLVTSGGSVFHGTVREIASMADQTTRTFEIKASLPADAQKALRLGMTAQAQFAAKTRQAIYVPRTAIVEQGKPGVWLEQDGVVHFVPVSLGDTQGDAVEVTAGLSLGDTIVTAGVQRLYDGEAVEVMAE